MDWLKGRGHWAWLAVAIIAAVCVFMFTRLIGSLIFHVVMWTIIGGLIYALDFKFTKVLGPHPMQFAAAIILAVIGGFLSKSPLWMVTVLALCDIVILMCVFSISARIWPNAEAIQERILNDPLGAAREGLSAGADAIKQGVGAAQTETERLGSHFKPSKPAT